MLRDRRQRFVRSPVSLVLEVADCGRAAVGSVAPALQIGRPHLGGLQKFRTCSRQCDAAIDHDIAAMGEAECVKRILLDEKYRHAITSVEL